MTVTIELLVDDVRKTICRVSKNDNIIIINNEKRVKDILEQIRDSCDTEDSFYIIIEPEFATSCFHEKEGSNYIIAHLGCRANLEGTPTIFYEKVNNFVAFIKNRTFDA